MMAGADALDLMELKKIADKIRNQTIEAERRGERVSIAVLQEYLMAFPPHVVCSVIDGFIAIMTEKVQMVRMPPQGTNTWN